MRLARRGVEHRFRVAVIGRDQHLAADLLHGGDHAADAFVEDLDRPRRGCKVAGVADHVAVRKVADDRIVAAGLDRLDQLVGDLVGAHLGLEVVGRDAGRGHEDAILAGIGGLDPPVEEIGNVGVFLGLGDAQLLQAALRKILAETVGHALRRERRGNLREVVAVARERAVIARPRDTLAREPVERRVGQRARQLPRAVGAKIHEDHRVAVAHRRGRADDARLHELVGLAARVSRVQRLHGGGAAKRRLALRDEIVGLAHALPALVAVHRVVAAADRGDAAAPQLVALALQREQRGFRALGRRVAPVEEGVHAHVAHASAHGHLQQRLDLRLVTVHAARREQAQDMQRLSGRARGFQRFDEHLVSRELAGLDRVLDAGVVLVDDAPGADVHVTHFRVAHLVLGQADPFFRGVDGGVRIARHECVPARLPRLADRVVLALFAMAEAIEYDQQDRD